MHPDAKGYYIETIFTNEVETIVRFDKEKVQNQICSYDKKEDVYFLGNNHIEGKIEGEGKSIIIKDNKYINIYKGKIHKNKICCQLLNLNEQSDTAILKIPNISIFDEKSVIESKIHKHKLIYASVKSSWKCNSCSKLFNENTYSYGCKECNFNLCMKCLFDPNIQNRFKEKSDGKYNSTASNHEKRLKKLEEILFKRKTIENGMYIIKSMSCINKVIQMDNNNLIVWDFKNENNQKFNINYNSSGCFYTIQNIENNQYLTCDDSTIYFTSKNNKINQQWLIMNNVSGGYEIVLEKNKKIMQVEENAYIGSKISCQNKTGKSNQIFNFEITTKKEVSYFPKPNWHGPYINQVSIVDALASVGYPYDKNYRSQIGIRNNIPGVPFSPEYNTHMLNLMKQGKLIIP